jgi:hypothetical protein
VGKDITGENVVGGVIDTGFRPALLSPMTKLPGSHRLRTRLITGL